MLPQKLLALKSILIIYIGFQAKHFGLNAVEASIFCPKPRDVGVLLVGNGNCPQKLWYVNTKKLASKKAWQPKLVVLSMFWGQKMNPSHCRNWYSVPKTPIRSISLPYDAAG
jgi:hypothetical protein